jgi:hypothetical protein
VKAMEDERWRLETAQGFLPAGYAIVPIKPTKAMIGAACRAMSPEHRPTPDRVSVTVKHTIRFQAMVQAFGLVSTEDQTEAAA